jgi:RNA polymerase sigma-70 factor (ECF subfamily)
MDERALISCLQSGDPAAFAKLYDWYASRILGFLIRLTGNRADAEDLLQEVFLAAYVGRAGFQGKSTLLTWLLGIALRRWRDRTRQVRAETDFRIDAPLVVESVEDRTASGDLAASVVDRLLLSNALQALEPTLRDALLLIHSQGLTYREAAQILQEPIGTVKWRVYEALKRLHRAFDASEEEQDDVVRQVPSGADYSACKR